MTGVYEIKSLTTGRRLVNGSTSVKKSIKRIFDDLYYGVCKHKELQDSYNESPDSIVVELLIICKTSEVVDVERNYMLQHINDSSLMNTKDAYGIYLGEAQIDSDKIIATHMRKVMGGKAGYLKTANKQLLELRRDSTAVR